MLLLNVLLSLLPTLTIHGRESYQLSQAPQMKERIPNSALGIIEGAEHTLSKFISFLDLGIDLECLS